MCLEAVCPLPFDYSDGFLYRPFVCFACPPDVVPALDCVAKISCDEGCSSDGFWTDCVCLALVLFGSFLLLDDVHCCLALSSDPSPSCVWIARLLFCGCICCLSSALFFTPIHELDPSCCLSGVVAGVERAVPPALLVRVLSRYLLRVAAAGGFWRLLATAGPRLEHLHQAAQGQNGHI